MSKNLENLTKIRYIGAIYLEEELPNQSTKSTSQQEKKLATKKETEDMIVTKVTESSVTLKADDWRSAVKTIYVPTKLVLDWTGAKTKEDIDLNQRYELTIGLKDKS